jgi:GTP pyrophosphokinase
MMHLEYELRDGDIVEIIRRKGSTPNLSWIREGKVKSATARQKIRHFFHIQKRQEMMAEGQIIVQKYLKSINEIYIGLQDIIDVLIQTKGLSRSTGVEDLYLAVSRLD